MKYTIIAIIKPLTTPLIKPIDLSSFSPKGTIFTALDIKCIINGSVFLNGNAFNLGLVNLSDPAKQMIN